MSWAAYIARYVIGTPASIWLAIAIAQSVGGRHEVLLGLGIGGVAAAIIIGVTEPRS